MIIGRCDQDIAVFEQSMIGYGFSMITKFDSKQSNIDHLDLSWDKKLIITVHENEVRIFNT